MFVLTNININLNWMILTIQVRSLTNYSSNIQSFNSYFIVYQLYAHALCTQPNAFTLSNILEVWSNYCHANPRYTTSHRGFVKMPLCCMPMYSDVYIYYTSTYRAPIYSPVFVDGKQLWTKRRHTIKASREVTLTMGCMRY